MPVWSNGRLVPREEATVSVFDHGLLYGDGVFEGIRIYSAGRFRLDAHLARLERPAHAIGLRMRRRDPRRARAALRDRARHQRSTATSASSSRAATARSVSTRDVHAPVCHHRRRRTLSPALLEHGIRALVTAATRQVPAASVDPRIKSLNYLETSWRASRPTKPAPPRR